MLGELRKDGDKNSFYIYSARWLLYLKILITVNIVFCTHKVKRFHISAFRRIQKHVFFVFIFDTMIKEDLCIEEHKRG